MEEHSMDIPAAKLEPAPKVMPPMGELTCSRHLVGNHEAIAAAWERDGYLFFRDVLDKNVIAGIRKVYVDYLVKNGLADAGDPDHLYNGGDLSNLPNSAITDLNKQRVDRLLNEAPSINAFFGKVFGCDPLWIPFTRHRNHPPERHRKVQRTNKQSRSQFRFDFIHEDGTHNVGLPFMVCWVPIDDMDDPDVGGLALLEGVHNGPCLHHMEGMRILPIRLEDVPADRWRSAQYKTGDVVLMHRHTPHSGLTNLSDNRFRMSMDTRIMPSKDTRLLRFGGVAPMMGTLTSISDVGLSMVDARGERRVRFDGKSFVHGTQVDQIPLSEVPDHFKIGDPIIVAFHGDVVVHLRPQE
jgi:hypothetical protein